MKNKQKWLWIISIIVIGFAAVSCADDNCNRARSLAKIII